MRGFNSTKIPYVTDLLNRFSILFLIEHCLNNKQLSDLSANFPGYSIFGVSAISDGNCCVVDLMGVLLLYFQIVTINRCNLLIRILKDYVPLIFSLIIL